MSTIPILKDIKQQQVHSLISAKIRLALLNRSRIQSMIIRIRHAILVAIWTIFLKIKSLPYKTNSWTSKRNSPSHEQYEAVFREYFLNDYKSVTGDPQS